MNNVSKAKTLHEHLSELHADIDRAKSTLLKLRDKADTLERELRKQVQNGESTGDRIVDLLLRTGRTPTKNALENYRELDAALKGKRGELVLVTYTVGEAEVRGGPGMSRDRVIDMVAVGVLHGDSLVYDEKRHLLALPVGRYITFREPSFVSLVGFHELSEHPALLSECPEFDVYDGRFTLDPKQYVHCTVTQLLLRIGDDAVREWLLAAYGMFLDTHSSESAIDNLFAQLCEQVGRLLLQPTETVEGPSGKD